MNIRIIALTLIVCLISISASADSGYESVRPIAVSFKNMTEVKQARWIEQNDLTRSVKGAGVVKQVEETGFGSQIRGDYYEVTVDIGSGVQAIVYFSKSNHTWVADLDPGQKIEFKGKLKTLKNWGFWISAYVLAD